MPKFLVIVESPAKQKTLKKFLGANYSLASSVGHIRDLPEKGLGIDIENDFTPEYVVMPKKQSVIDTIKKEAKKVEVVYLAPDPDREGEAIAWHIAQILPKKKKIHRIAFHSITKSAVLEALEHPREINQQLVGTQQARRLLDRIVGYKISPILTRKVRRGKKGISAGRVQSVALKLVVDREKEIEAHVPVEYWNLSVSLSTDLNSKPFVAHLYSVQTLKVEKEPVAGKKVCLISEEKTALALLDEIKTSNFSVKSVSKKEKKRNPVPPFITSTLQQEAARHFGYNASRTMGIAQSLYEGVDLGNRGTEGLITYMRTDSVNIAKEAIGEVRACIRETYGKDLLPEKPNVYSSKKSAQEAHEAIRPTNLQNTPEQVQAYLDIDQRKLYGLIWKRFIASQMKPALFDTVSCEIITEYPMIFRATGMAMKYKGFLLVYEEKKDTSTEEPNEEIEGLLPPLEKGQALVLKQTSCSQAFTKPKSRFTESSLVRELERCGIGRPSTYASIMNKIHSREYTTKEKNTLKPTELGRIIAQMLEENFASIMDVGFTAKMEDALESIASSSNDWKKIVRDFWKDFFPLVEKAEKEARVPKVPTDLDCPKCGQKLEKIWAKDRYFYGCTQYPDCDYTAAIEALSFDKSEYADGFDWEQKCHECGAEMNIRHGKYGAFLGCSNYPDCKGIVNIPKKGEPLFDHEEAPKCPAIGCEGKIVPRKSRFGKTFFSCTTFPSCDVIVNDLEGLQEKYPDHPKTAYKKKKGKGGFQTKQKLSKNLGDLLGEKELSRAEATKKIWHYIKEQELQNPENRRQIVPDERLAKVCGSKTPFDMMQIPRILSENMGN
ncbi:MAG: type I DNA topoisomerase [Chlamydiota bacterium]